MRAVPPALSRRPDGGEASPPLPSLLMVALCIPRVPPKKPLFSELPARNINRVTLGVFANLQIPHAGSLSPHGFRRVGAQELKGRGSQWATVAGSGGWRSLDSRGYVGDISDISRAMDRSLIDDCDPDSIGDEKVSLCGRKPPPYRLWRCAMCVGVFRSRRLRGIVSFSTLAGCRVDIFLFAPIP